MCVCTSVYYYYTRISVRIYRPLALANIIRRTPRLYIYSHTTRRRLRLGRCRHRHRSIVVPTRVEIVGHSHGPRMSRSTHTYFKTPCTPKISIISLLLLLLHTFFIIIITVVIFLYLVFLWFRVVADARSRVTNIIHIISFITLRIRNRRRRCSVARSFHYVCGRNIHAPRANLIANGVAVVSEPANQTCTMTTVATVRPSRKIRKPNFSKLNVIALFYTNLSCRANDSKCVSIYFSFPRFKHIHFCSS